MSIASEIERISSAKDNIRTAIIAKGGTVSADALIDAYPAAISAIPQSGGGVSSTTYYKCASVGAGTWTGNQLLTFSGGVMYPDISSSTSLSYSPLRTPSVGGTYTSDAVVSVSVPSIIGLAHFDGNTSDVILNSAYTFSGTASYVAGKFDSALSVNSNNYVVTPITTDDLKSDFTIDFWVYTSNGGTGTSTRCAPLAAWVDHWIGVDNYQGTWNFWAGNGGNWFLDADYDPSWDSSGRGTIPIASDTWTHLACVHAGNNYYLFVNGSQSVSRTLTQTIGESQGGSSYVLKLGRWGADNFGAPVAMDEFCVRTYAAWTSDFTPPNAPYSVN